MLDQEFKFYREHQQELVAQHKEHFIVIVGDKVVGSYQSEVEAYFNTIEEYEPGTFLIQYVEEGEDSYTQVFHSRVSF